jgi:ppGpp synthetase/RelA/SpoT-type nucleotidyltranferase
MAWAKRQYTKGQIDRAGAALIGQPLPTAEEFERALAVINNWRSCHSYPLQAVKMTLLRRAKSINRSALIAQRLKRLPSIAIKLRDNPAMKLSQMQDIGGCRAVMPSFADMRKLIAAYEKSRSKNPRHGRPVQHEKYDYIRHPKPDGYRSYHLIFKYQSKYEDKRDFNGQRIEIQIRSRLQHAWATAVETVQTFTGQALKSKVKVGDPQWLRFFALMGSAIAHREKSPLVPGTPEKGEHLIQEIRDLSERLSVEHVLRMWGYAVHRLTAEPSDAVAFLLVLDSGAKSLEITPFKAGELDKASETYARVERETRDHPEVQAVLVSVETVEALPAAYPNFYLDTSVFIDAMNQATQR